MTNTLPKIRLLDPVLINQIAAGEVVERPLNVVKELIENALDANCNKIIIRIEDGGRSLIEVQDDGHGMSKDQLELALTRHATSKIEDNDLFNIRSFGFRGEALPSIASIARVTIASRPLEQDIGYTFSVEGGEKKGDVAPIKLDFGTTITVSDLFYATPVRLKFLKSATTEQSYILDIIEKIAFANPSVGFELIADQKTILNLNPQELNESDSIQNQWESYTNRIKDICKQDIVSNCRNVYAVNEGISLKGLISMPTYHKAKATDQYFFVNNRPIRDKILINALRAAYKDVLEHNRHPFVILFLDLDPFMVDLNAHPNKTEVRFRDAQWVRNFIVSALDETLKSSSRETASYLSEKAVASFTTTSSLKDFASHLGQSANCYSAYQEPLKPQPFPKISSQRYRGHNTSSPLPFYDSAALKFEEPRDDFLEFRDIKKNEAEPPEKNDFELGVARCQLFDTYILAQKSDALVLIDQHAAHERLRYEKLKKQILNSTVPRSILLFPEVMNLKANESELLKTHQERINQLGFFFDIYPQSIVVREIPIILEGGDVQSFLRDILNDLLTEQDPITLLMHQTEKLAEHACHNSIRAGQKLSVMEMNELLRSMEETPFSGQCNHGRPTHISLSLVDIEKLFGRR
jgi:DNA mismatch repair protein MutL